MTTTAAAAAGTASSHDPQFPCSIVLRVPLPTSRLASTALEALQVDPELSPLVRRRFSLARLSPTSSQDLVLQVDYQATTNRMLRVAVNSFMDSLKLILEVMEHLDVDVLAHHQPASEPQS
ncbi:hypothetical protein HIM_02362 [Hirsutella minnesotensis 3608]|nr:hypothetical protein HIM_02362 [Hirsutella minnesotensis 3608]